VQSPASAKRPANTAQSPIAKVIIDRVVSAPANWVRMLQELQQLSRQSLQNHKSHKNATSRGGSCSEAGKCAGILEAGAEQPRCPLVACDLTRRQKQPAP